MHLVGIPTPRASARWVLPNVWSWAEGVQELGEPSPNPVSKVCEVCGLSAAYRPREEGEQSENRSPELQGVERKRRVGKSGKGTAKPTDAVPWGGQQGWVPCRGGHPRGKPGPRNVPTPSHQRIPGGRVGVLAFPLPAVSRDKT